MPHATTNGIRLHYLDHPGEAPPLVLLHGLTTNAHNFDGLLAAGLRHRLIAPDLRGRGLSDHPVSDYAMADHAADIVGLLDALGLERVALGGHSFGGLLTMYIAAHHPDRVERLIVMDAAARLHPRVRDLIQPALDRLGVIHDSWEAYLATIRAMPAYHDWWDRTIESLLRADVVEDEAGRVRARSSAAAIAAAVEGSVAVDWPALLERIHQPVLMLNAARGYGEPDGPAVVPVAQARETVEALPDARYVAIPGNHMTMLYGEGAARVVAAIEPFLKGE